MKKLKNYILILVLVISFNLPSVLRGDSLHELYTVDGKKYRGKFVAFKFNTIYFIPYEFGNAKKREIRLPISKIWKLVLNPDAKNNVSSIYELENKYKKLRRGKSVKRISLNSKDKWITTKLNVKKNQQILFTITGEIQIDKKTRIDHTGEPTTHWNKNKPLPTYPTGAVIARFGELGQAFYVGNNKAPFIADKDCVLYVGINDFSFNNNSGNFAIIIYY